MYERSHARGGDLNGQIGGENLGVAGPGVSCKLARARIESDGDASREGASGALDQLEVLHRGGSEYRPLNTEGEHVFEVPETSNASAELNPATGGFHDLPDDCAVYGPAGTSAVEVDDVNPRGSTFGPSNRGAYRRIVEYG